MEVGWEQVGYDAKVTALLVAEIQQDLTGRYGGPDETPVDPAEFGPAEWAVPRRSSRRRAGRLRGATPPP